MHNKGQITLVGAGPGDPELITLKGVNALQKADVIFYDALISPLLLEHNRSAEKIFVGKRSGQHQTSQEDINRWIVSYALQDKNVVRLKGGDPLVFGRACEELNSAKENGIPTFIVPGISSFSGIAAQHQIPITKRQEHQSFWVVTGHTAAGKFSEDLYWAAQSSATVIVLMGVRHLAKIVALFQVTKTGDYPVAIVQNGTTKAERSLVATLDTIEEEVTLHVIENPAVLFFGPAVTDAVTHFRNPVNALKCLI
jgi:uroporphyrin-III C-methyltransferase